MDETCYVFLTAKFTDGSNVVFDSFSNSGNPIEWKSSDPSVGYADFFGFWSFINPNSLTNQLNAMIVTVAPGYAVISAEYNGITASCGISVANRVSFNFYNMTATGFVESKKVSDYPPDIGELAFFNKYGDPLGEDEFITTGCKVINQDMLYDIIITGDADGDGKVSGNDYIIAMKIFLGDPAALELDSVYKTAADADGSGTVDGNDYIIIMKHFLGDINIYNNLK